MKQVVFISGGTRGIGLATALRFAEKDYIVLINGRDEEVGKVAIARIQASGADGCFYSGDISDENVVIDIMNRIKEEYGKIDILINNAGSLLRRHLIEEMESGFWNEVMALNLDSVFYSIKHALPLMKQGGGCIVNLTSIAAYTGGGSGIAAYAAAKAAVLALTRSSAKELVQYGIRVNAVSPGIIKTDFHNSTDPVMLEKWKETIPAGRLGTAEDVANAILFLTSKESDYLVGEVIQINGGQFFG